MDLGAILAVLVGALTLAASAGAVAVTVRSNTNEVKALREDFQELRGEFATHVTAETEERGKLGGRISRVEGIINNRSRSARG